MNLPNEHPAPRIGCVQYLNARPLIHGWKGPVTYDHPSALCRKLAAGELDVALVSSFEYLRHPVYSVVDRLAIASDGPVYSVILAHLAPLEELREVVLDPASETSSHLLRCLLGDRGITVDYRAEGELSPTRGRLLIGDQAIRFRQKADARYRFLDLGAAWKKATALPFVYALWLIRPDFAGKHELAGALRELAAQNLQNLDALIAKQTDVDPGFCELYLRRCLRFSFAEGEKEGFQKFAELCLKQKLLPNLPPAPALV